MTAEDAKLQEFIDSLPEPNDTSQWDSLFLLNRAPRLDEYWMLFWAICVRPEGEMHQQWLASHSPPEEREC